MTPGRVSAVVLAAVTAAVTLLVAFAPSGHQVETIPATNARSTPATPADDGIVCLVDLDCILHELDTMGR